MNALVERRAKQAAVEDLWEASVKREKERRDRWLRAEWYAYHVGQAERLRRTMAALVENHEARAADLLEEPEGGGR